jgi:hypothetical protein
VQDDNIAALGLHAIEHGRKVIHRVVIADGHEDVARAAKRR